ncbi:hypothetical protein CC85DRAFT_305951 [Cutaneotrichosporon oleaginosum]|uniref:C2H2-type domain-containing protein n=1 Tax=Cutaneotrichosporon oleaginosum TaxID=879819 RepID=A0A0J0XBN2_9TREE|nr:uncharacterized protein CC85DRAFT_305951 [Cutaneotrichosporon oleaginosum]KLT38462.1 hypothetical protein CC85DRAFT_305951 [Cutaneotrichosporon oleaginosum]TXT05428.1 hypothetical protein COLE_06748 [Cutaneotrichosporon oleaginosum]
MSFGAAMSGVSFGNSNAINMSGVSFGNSNGRSFRQGSYGNMFYDGGSPRLFDSAQMPFGQSINMDGSFATSSAAFNLAGSYRGGRSYAEAAKGLENYSPAMLSSSLASTSLRDPNYGSYMGSYKRSQLERMLSTSVGRNKESEEVYQCCGSKFVGLHALTEHVEENPNDHQDDPEPHNDGGMFSPLVMGMDLDLETDPYNVPSTTNSTRSSTSPRPVPNYPLTPTNSTAPRAETATSNDSSTANGLKLSEWLKSPTNNDASSVLPGALGTDGGNVVDLSSGVPKFASAVRGGFNGGKPLGGRQRFDRAFNEVVAGRAGLEDPNKPPGPIAVAPSVLFTKVPAMGLPQASAVVGRREGTVGTPAGAAAVPAPVATNGAAAPVANGATAVPAAPAAAAAAAADVKKEGEENTDKKDVVAGGEAPPPPPPGAKAPDARAADTPLPPPSLFTTHKAWRCPNPGCNKAYKQSNGLKYHLAKGQCDFAIHDAIDNGLTLEEAEQRARPYVCAVGAGCDKRYRQMNGLKYHYLNTGEHGEYGLRMLANGTHPQPVHHPPMPKRDRSQQPRNNGAPIPNANAGGAPAARASAAPYSVPQRPTASANLAINGRPGVVTGVPVGVGAPKPPGPRMGTWPVPQRAGVPTPTARAAPTAPVPAPAPAPAPTMPVQRGRDAVLFSNVDFLDV